MSLVYTANNATGEIRDFTESGEGSEKNNGSGRNATKSDKNVLDVNM